MATATARNTGESTTSSTSAPIRSKSALPHFIARATCGGSTCRNGRPETGRMWMRGPATSIRLGTTIRSISVSSAASRSGAGPPSRSAPPRRRAGCRHGAARTAPPRRPVCPAPAPRRRTVPRQAGADDLVAEVRPLGEHGIRAVISVGPPTATTRCTAVARPHPADHPAHRAALEQQQPGPDEERVEVVAAGHVVVDEVEQHRGHRGRGQRALQHRLELLVPRANCRFE